MPTKTSSRQLLSRMDHTASGHDGLAPIGPVNTVSRWSETITKSLTGNPLPKWRSIIKSGGNATTPMTGTDMGALVDIPFLWSATKKVLIPNSVDYEYTETDRGSLFYATQVPNHVSGTSIVDADNLALKQAYSRLASEQTQFQGVVFLGELAETIKLLRHPFKGVEQYYRTYFSDLKKSKSWQALNRSRTKRNRKSFLNTAADLHLEVAFGVKPLLSDVEDLYKTILQQRYGTKRTMIVGNGESVKAIDRSFVSPLGNLGRLSTHEVDTTTQAVRYKVAVDAQATAAYGSVEAGLSGLGFNLESFVPSIYNLIPYSFLADYFSNLGDVIEAGCNAQKGVSWVCKTTRLETVRTGYAQPGFNPSVLAAGNVAQLYAEPGSYVLFRRSVVRSSQAQLGMPTLTFSLPGSSMKVANILALLVGQNSSIRDRLRF